MEKQNDDAQAIGYVLFAGLCIAAGICIGGLGRDSDRALISQQSREIYQLERQLTETRAKFEGYRDGRR